MPNPQLAAYTAKATRPSIAGVTTFTFERVTLNGRKGWIATKRVGGVYCGRNFGATKAQASDF